METKQVEVNGRNYEIKMLKMGVMRHLMGDLTSSDDNRVQAAQEKMVAEAVSKDGVPAVEIMDDIAFSDYIKLIPLVVEFNGLGNEVSPQ
jgi:hypothetical protein